MDYEARLCCDAPMWSFIISLAVYFMTSWRATLFLANQGLDPGWQRKTLAMLCAIAASSLVGWGIDKVFPSQDLGLLKIVGTLSGGAPGAAPPELSEIESALKALGAAP